MAGSGAVVGTALRFGLAVAAATAVGVVIQAGALWWRRSYPVAVLLVIAGAELFTLIASPSREPSGIALAFAVYAVSVYGPSRVRLAVAGAAIVVVLAAVTLVILGYFPASRVLIPAGAFSLVAWVIGDYMRSRREFVAELVGRHQRDREQAAEEERLRIARELHDVVAHNVSVMAIQAGAARVSGNPSDNSKEALESIETAARDTLAELNRMLGILRKDPNAPLVPQPGLDQLGALLKTARDGGLDATLKVKGQTRTLPAAVDLSAYRIVQEAITNVLKHASATRVEVTVGYRAGDIVLIVSDNGRGSTQKDGASTGHGLIGMRERAELFEGDLRTRTSSLGGFMVIARLKTR